MQYKLKPIFDKFPQLTTVVFDQNKKPKSVSLTGKSTVAEKGGDKGGPPQKITIPAATQSEMKQLFDAGHPFIEQVLEQPKPNKED